MSTSDDVDNSSRIEINYSQSQPGPFQRMDLANFIKPPSAMDITPDVDGWGLDTIGRNFGGLISYVKLLIGGVSRASRVAAIDYPIGPRSNQPLGHAFFFNTGFECRDRRGKLQPAVAHINTVPFGNIPFLSANIQELRGLLPSMFETIGGLNPMILLSTLDISNGEQCNRDVERNPEYQLPFSNLTSNGRSYRRNGDPVQFTNAYMFDSLVRKIDPCLFRGPIRKLSNGTYERNGRRRNPITKDPCGDDVDPENFSNINDVKNINTELDKHLVMLNNLNKSDWLIQLYYISFSILIIFIIVKILNKHVKKM